MSVALRAPLGHESEAVASLSRSLWPDQAEDPAKWQKAESGYWVAVEGVTLLGYGCLRPDLPRMPEAGKFRLFVGVAPEWRNQGVGGLLFGRLLADLRAAGAAVARARLRHTDTEALAFLTRRGFTEYQRMLLLEQDLTAVSLPPLDPAVEMVTLKEELERRPDCLPAIHELQNAGFADIPSSDPGPLPTYAAFERSLKDPALLYDCFFLAKDGERYIGLSYAAKDPTDPGLLGHRFTGVHPEYRRRGIARALKVRVSRYAREHGFNRIVTATLKHNTGMRAVNEALGFTVRYEQIRLERPLTGGSVC